MTDPSRKVKPESLRLTRRGLLAAGCAVLASGASTALGEAARHDRAAPARKAVSLNPRLFTFVGGTVGPWRITSIAGLVGEPLPAVERLDILQGVSARPDGVSWVLRGATSNERYVTRAEKKQLVAKQAAIGRPEANRAALIPIRKNADWWTLTQDERRAIFESRSHHTEIGLKYLPAIARRLHHCRDLAETEPFDFLTFFEFAEKDAGLFESLLHELRASEEWKFVDREVDIRLARS